MGLFWESLVWDACLGVFGTVGDSLEWCWESVGICVGLFGDLVGTVWVSLELCGTVWVPVWICVGLFGTVWVLVSNCSGQFRCLFLIV